jgi:hypothetical protein
VLELRVLTEIEDRRGTRLQVALGVELEAEALAGLLVAAGPEQGPGLGEGEVDVEEDCVYGQTPVGER